MASLLNSLAALFLLFPPPDLSNHWRWASASVNQAATSPAPIPSPTPVIPSPTPNPVPGPSPTPTPTPTILKNGDDCPHCKGGWIASDGSARVACWQCNGDGVCNTGDPVLTGETHPDPLPIISPENKEGEGRTTNTPTNEDTQASNDSSSKEVENQTRTRPDVGPSLPNLPKSVEILSYDPLSKKTCYKPKYSDDGYWIKDVEANKWVRSAKQPPMIVKEVVPSKTGHYENRTYKSCNGRGCPTYTKKVWVADPPKTVTREVASKPLTSYYPVRGSWWTGCGSYRHLLTGPHRNKFNPEWLSKLSYEELQSLHSDDHEGRVKWQYVSK